MPGLLEDVDLLLTPAPADTKGVYDRVADRYEQFRALWVRLAGNAVERPMLEELDDILAPGLRVLDAGCGTGTLSRRMHAIEPEISLTLLDFSAPMLARTRDIPAARVLGSVLDLPFPDNSFDIVVSSWVIETVPNPVRAVSEYLRVINGDGYVLYTFCSLPHGWMSRAGTALLPTTIEHRFGGDFLRPEHTQWHDCDRSFRLRSHAGLTTLVSLRKCCSVGAPILPESAPPAA